ncbi:MAG: hypothetical protein JXR96_18685 [Deltaproteobacteria bacterium]|nr:hypothetical protein [Deltaproteobacteria bacterium]
MAEKKKYRLEALVLLGLGAVLLGYWAYSALSRLGCGEVDAAFERIVHRFADPAYRLESDELGLGREAVPCLLDRLTDVDVVAEIHHPGGHDRLGMPLVGHTQQVLARELAVQMLARIASRSQGPDPELEAEIESFLLSQTSDPALVLQSIGHEVFERHYEPVYSFVLRSFGRIGLPEARRPLEKVLLRFMTKDDDWKWSHGRTLIGALLESLAKLGDAQTVARIVKHVKKPGCDFLYTDFEKCLAAIGGKNVPAIAAGIESLVRGGDAKWGMLGASSLLRALGSIRSEPSLAFLLDFADRKGQLEGWLHGEAIEALGKHDDPRVLARLAREFLDGDQNSKASAEHGLYGLLNKRRAVEFAQQLERPGEDDASLAAVFALGVLAGEQELAFLKGLQGSKRFCKMRDWAVAKAEARIRQKERERLKQQRYNAWQEVVSHRVEPQEVAELLYGLLEFESLDSYTPCQVMDYLAMASQKTRLPPKFRRAIRKRLESKEIPLRLCAAGALGRTGDRSGLELVRSVLESPDKNLQYFKPRACVEYLKITREVHPLLEKGVRAEDQAYLNMLFYLERRDRLPVLRQLVRRLSREARDEAHATRALQVLEQWKQQEKPSPRPPPMPRAIKYPEPQ